MHSRGTVGRIVLSIAAFAAAIPCAHAGVIDVPVEQDAGIFGGAANVNHSSSGPGLFVGTDAQKLPKRGLIEFPVSSYVPAGATVTSVVLELTLGQIAGSGTGTQAGPNPDTIRLYAVATPWQGGTNGTTGFAGPGFGGTGQGFTAQPGNATWADASYDTVAWRTAGGDFAAAQSAAAAVGTSLNTAYAWGSTPQMVADVQGWLDGSLANDGWLLKNDDETGAYSYRAFYTAEGAVEQGAPQHAPELVVTFAVPEPSSLALSAAGLGALGFLRSRRRRPWGCTRPCAGRAACPHTLGPDLKSPATGIDGLNNPI